LSFAVIIDHHVRGDSFVHGLDPRAKLITALVFIFSAVLIPQGAWPVFVAHACVIAIAIALSGLSTRFVLGRSILALPFVLAAVPVLFHRPGDTLFEVPLAGWTATYAGLEALSSILLRSWLSVTAATILTATTEPDHLLHSLRWLGVPRLLVATISFMWRYVFVIAEEAQRLLRARDARSARPGGHVGGSLAWRARVAGNMVGTLFLRSLNRSERVYTAMLARGYNGELRSLERFSLRPQDVAAAATVVAALVLIQLYARL
jgi:cobalt/nickel transport system permease protein